MPTKTQQLQIRVTARQKARLKQLASAAGMDVSAYVLARALEPGGERFQDIIDTLGRATPADRSYLLADLNDLLDGLAGAEIAEVTGRADVGGLDSYLRNYVAAMVEQAAHRGEAAAPKWTKSVRPLEEPRFATDLRSLRPHLLRAAPVPFKRRNIFVDASIGDRV